MPRDAPPPFCTENTLELKSNVSSTSHMRLLPAFASYFDVSVENITAQTNVEKLMLYSIIC